MVLVIPAIELSEGQCRRQFVGESGMEAYYEYLRRNPAELAQLLRQENARSLHIVDLDGLNKGKTTVANCTAIEDITAAVDIPVELLSVFRTSDDCQQWFHRGIFRLVLSDMIITSPEEVEQLVRRYTASRLVAGIRARNRRVMVAGAEIDDVAFALAAKALGIHRVIYSDIAWEGTYHGPDFELVMSFAQLVGMRITIAGGIDNPEELWRCNDLLHYGVDSVIVGRAIAENRFPCQYIWRRVEAIMKKKNAPLEKSS